jgi:hypothetical protein
MKKIITILCLNCFLCLSAYSQAETNSCCESVLKEVLHVHTLKVKYEAAQELYPAIKDKNSYFYMILSAKHRAELLKLIVDNSDPFPEFEEIETSQVETGSVTVFDKEKKTKQLESGLMPVKKVSDKEKEWYIGQLTKSIDEYFTDYQNSIIALKSKKELCLQCIEEELAKGELSEYKQKKLLYNYNPPMRSVLSPVITKFDFLRIFKEFIFNDEMNLLPDGNKAYVYLHCNCKLP